MNDPNIFKDEKTFCCHYSKVTKRNESGNHQHFLQYTSKLAVRKRGDFFKPYIRSAISEKIVFDPLAQRERQNQPRS